MARAQASTGPDGRLYRAPVTFDAKDDAVNTRPVHKTRPASLTEHEKIVEHPPGQDPTWRRPRSLS